MAEYLIDSSILTSIADQIRAKDGTTAKIKGYNLAARIKALPNGATVETGEFYQGSYISDTTIDLGFSESIPSSDDFIFFIYGAPEYGSGIGSGNYALVSYCKQRIDGTDTAKGVQQPGQTTNPTSTTSGVSLSAAGILTIGSSVKVGYATYRWVLVRL